ncbi:hypothetical protein lerEdw1_003750 [Lerista edwardsae]|nr:hypothetical protein lerEdw1_003750 [Lerista edwardsae]
MGDRLPEQTPRAAIPSPAVAACSEAEAIEILETEEDVLPVATEDSWEEPQFINLLPKVKAVSSPAPHRPTFAGQNSVGYKQRAEACQKASVDMAPFFHEAIKIK